MEKINPIEHQVKNLANQIANQAIRIAYLETSLKIAEQELEMCRSKEESKE